MKKTLLIAKKELVTYFNTPIALILMTFFLTLAGIYFYSIIANFQIETAPGPLHKKVIGMNVNDNVIFPFFSNLQYLFFLMVPVITMRLFAEEKRLGTLELLCTYPLKPIHIILGKYLGALSFTLFLLLFTLIYVFIILHFSIPEIGPIVTTYIGFILFLMFYTAAGLLTSSLTENQIIAALSCFAIALSFYFFRWLAFVSPPPLDSIFVHFLLLEHITMMKQGVILTGDLIVFPSLILIILFLVYRRLKRI